MITPSPSAIEAAAKFYEFLGQHGVAKTIHERKGFRTTAEVFAQFEEEITTPLLDDRNDRAAERELLCQDKDVNNVIQTRLETGVWRINARGFLTHAGGSAT